MSRNIGRFFAYGRSSLADADRMMPDGNRMHEGVSLSTLEIESGRVRQDRLKLLVKVLESPEWESGTWRRASICPYVFVLKTGHAELRIGMPQMVATLWIPVLLDSTTGKIIPDYEMPPWIPRNILDPQQSPSITIGSIDSVDSFMGLHPAPTGNAEDIIASGEDSDAHLAAWIGWGRSLLEWVSGFDRGIMEIDGYEPVDDGLLFPIAKTSAIVRPLLNLYDHLIRDVPDSNTTRWLVADDFPDLSSRAGWDKWSALRLHVSHLPGLPALSQSQRWMLRRHLQQHNLVYPVNGPPGTGKSTLIAQIIIQGWTHAALRKDASPPLTLVTSTSNQALMRIMDILSSMPAGTRWTDFNVGAGLWFVGQSKSEQAESRFPGAWTDGVNSGLSGKIGLQATIYRQKKLFISRCIDEMGIDDLDKAQDAIYEKIKALAAPLGDSARLKKEEKNAKSEQDAIISSFNAGSYSFDKLQERTRDALVTRERIVRKMAILLSKWDQHKKDAPVWNKILEIIPAVRGVNIDRNHRFFKNLGIVPSGIDMRSTKSITESIYRMHREMKKLLDESRRQWNKIRRVAEQSDALNKKRQQLIDNAKWAMPIKDGMGHPDEIWEDERDLKERSEIFIWTVRYWECMWLRRAEHSRPSFVNNLRDLACLVPCFVSTLHSAPRFFVPWKASGPVYDLFDTMVIDEAGQVSIEVALPLFPLAKQVVVAGDPEQIEPIFGIPESTDIGNLMKEGLLHHPDDFVNFEQTNLAASSGNLQKRVDLLTVQPLWLTEQHRSHPDLVQFCNRLSYDDRLRAKRINHEGALPAFGFDHIPGEAKMFRGSWTNAMEAEAITEWISTNHKEWRAWYGNAPLEKIIGVITPFVQQAALLQQLFEKAKINIQVGTVHAFQGSERPIIIFSPTQTISEKTEPAFFDRKPNFLNVAVSRAQDSFWIVGNLNDWYPENHLPSGLLASFAMNNENSWFRNIWLPARSGHTFRKSEERWVNGSHKDILTILSKTSGDVHMAMPIVRMNIMEREGWLDFFKKRLKSSTVSLYINRSFIKWNDHEDLLELQDAMISMGVEIFWTEGLMDSMIWSGDVMMEFSTPIMGMDNTTQFRYYEGDPVLWITRKTMNRWTFQDGRVLP